MEQGSETWRLARCGRATASRFADILAKVKSGEAASRRNLRLQLVTERLTGIPAESYENAAMRHGTEQEPMARMAFEARTGMFADEVGFIPHADMMAGCSPDGLIGADGGLEIKAPYNSAVHVETLERGMPPEHVAQVQGSMWVTGRSFWWFVSFDPRMPENLRLYTQKIERDDAYIKALDAEVRKFLGEVEEWTERLRKRAA